MFNFLIALAMPPLLVFGLYHLMTWVSAFGASGHVFWKRVALASALSHVILAAGFFAFTYFDYQANREMTEYGASYGAYLFNRSEFWRLGAIFDTAAVLLLIAFFSILARFELALPGLVGITVVTVFLIGTLQWYVVGGLAGAGLERFLSGLKTGDDDEEEWS